MSQPIHLPSYPTAFIGRDHEIATVARRLGDPACRLLTLLGPGGIGKTRLAVEAAKFLASETGSLSLTNGVYFIDLQPVSDSDLIVTTIANTLGMMLSGSEPPREQLLTYLTERETLLILDNFEQLLDGVDLLSDIAQAAPNVKLLVTSREALNIQEEWLWKLSGLNVPDHQSDTSVESYSAAQLFTERAQHIHQDFSTIGQETHVARICQLVEGMPLALELAAGWTKALACAEIASELQHGLDFLTTNMRNLPDRHRSMQAVFEHSWRLLTASERAVFPKLSVFRGGFPRGAAEQVAGASLTILAGLVDKSFLRLSASGRYEVHELMRQYGEQRLDDADSIRDVHSSYYLQFLAERDADIKGLRQIEALNEIDSDFENVRAAWDWAVEHTDYAALDPAMDTLALLNWDFAHDSRAKDLLRRASKHLAPKSGHAPHPTWYRMVVRSSFDDDPDVKSIQEYLAITSARHDLYEMALCLLRLGVHAAENDEPSKGIALLEQSLDCFRSIDDRFYVARVMWQLAAWNGNVGEVERQDELLRELFRLLRENDDRFGIPWCLFLYARRAHVQGDYVGAERILREAIALHREVGNVIGVALSSGYLSNVIFAQGNFEEARLVGEQAIKLGVEINYLTARESGLLTLSLIADMEEDYVSAMELCQMVKRIRAIAAINAMAACSHAIASYGMDDYQAAKRSIQPALVDGHPANNVGFLIWYLPIVAMILAHEGDKAHAIELIGAALTRYPDAAGWLKRWPLLMRLRENLQAELGAEAYTAAWERGKTIDLKTVVQSLLERWKEQPEPQEDSNQALVDSLTPRELDVLRLIVAGHSNRQIARSLILSVGTVKFYTHTIYSKLNVASRTQAAARARELNLL